MEKLSYKLPSFEGPLDLLLYLLSKHKLDICDIPDCRIVGTIHDAYGRNEAAGYGDRK